MLFKLLNAILVKCQKFWSLIVYLNLNIAVKSRENKDDENSGGVEQQPFLGPNTDPKSEGIYWTNIQGISKKINTQCQNVTTITDFKAYSTDNLNLYMINDSKGYTHDGIS